MALLLRLDPEPGRSVAIVVPALPSSPLQPRHATPSARKRRFLPSESLSLHSGCATHGAPVRAGGPVRGSGPSSRSGASCPLNFVMRWGGGVGAPRAVRRLEGECSTIEPNAVPAVPRPQPGYLVLFKPPPLSLFFPPPIAEARSSLRSPSTLGGGEGGSDRPPRPINGQGRSKSESCALDWVGPGSVRPMRLRERLSGSSLWR